MYLKHYEIVLQGAAAISKWRKENPKLNFDLIDADLNGVNLEGADLYGADLRMAKLRGANLQDVDLRDADLSDADLSNADLSRADLAKSNLSNSNLSEAILTNALLQHAILKKTKLIKADMTDAGLASTDLRQANLSDAILNRAYLFEANLQGAYLINCNLSESILDEANLNEAILLGANFNGASITDAKLLNVAVNSDTSFQNIIDITESSIDRFAISCLGNNRGGLTDGNLITMSIHDDVAKLRSEFSGIWGALHFLAIISFLIPYLWFLIQQRIEASFQETNIEHSIPLSTALIRYIWNGGVNWENGWNLHLISFSTFLVFIIYNFLRLSLLYKTKKLETQQEVSALPAMFSFEKSIWWKRIFYITKFGMIVYLLCVIFNLYHFLQMRVPIEAVK